jgi:MFS family permease
MKIDLVGPRRRGLALGLNEASGYVALAVAALATGLIAERAGLRPVPFLVGLAIVGLGLGASIFLVRETRGHAVHEGSLHAPGETLSWLDVIRRTSWGDRTLFGASQAGLVNNLNDGLAWGLLPLFFAQRGLSIGEIAVLAAAYPATWGVAQLVTGALSDRLGRRPLVVGGMALQAVALAGVAAGSGFDSWLATLIALGIGTAMVYPTLIAVVADVAAPSWRASAVGVYRLWRDLGFAAGALVAGTVADRLGLEAAIGVVAALTGASAMIAAAVIRETRVR